MFLLRRKGKTINPPIRITDSANTPDAANPGRMVPFCAPEYSLCCWNADSTRLVLDYGSYFALHEGVEKFFRNLVFIDASAEPRWSRKNPDLLYFHKGNTLKRYNAFTDQVEDVHTFTGFDAISGLGEGDISPDDDHFALAGQQIAANGDLQIVAIFVYEISSKTVGPLLAVAGHAIDSLYIDSKNRVVISFIAEGTDSFQGIWLYGPNMREIHNMFRCDGHKCVTQRADGSDIMIVSNSEENPPTLPDFPNGIVAVDLDTSKQEGWLALPWDNWNEADHMSDAGGRACVAIYSAPSAEDPTEKYRGQILMVGPAPNQVEILANHGSVAVKGDYEAQAWASFKIGRASC